MATPYDQQIEDLLAEYRDAREEAADAFQQLGDIRATAVAPRQVVKVTVGGRGEVMALDFPTGAFRNMAPKDLSRVIMATLEEARGKAMAQAMEVGLGGLPEGIKPADMMSGNFDPRDLLPKEMKLPEAVREFIERGVGPVKRDGGRA
jgi:DNA-binding protein YbaB